MSKTLSKTKRKARIVGSSRRQKLKCVKKLYPRNKKKARIVGSSPRRKLNGVEKTSSEKLKKTRRGSSSPGTSRRSSTASAASAATTAPAEPRPRSPPFFSPRRSAACPATKALRRGSQSTGAAHPRRFFFQQLLGGMPTATAEGLGRIGRAASEKRVSGRTSFGVPPHRHRILGAFAVGMLQKAVEKRLFFKICF